MSFPQRAPSSHRAPVIRTKFAIESNAPLPSLPSKELGDTPELLEFWRQQTGVGEDEHDKHVEHGHYRAELDAMTTLSMKRLGVEVLDTASMLAYRSDAHTEEKRDTYSRGHSCLPGPLDDVNSLIVNRLCRMD